MILAVFAAIWGCIPEITKDCDDMTNASSTYLGIVIGAAIGAAVSWWIYNRQKKTSDKQDIVLNRIKELEEMHEKLLKKIEKIEQKNETVLKHVLEADRKVEDTLNKAELGNLKEQPQQRQQAQHHGVGDYGFEPQKDG